MRGNIRKVWLLNAAPSAGAGAAVHVPTQCWSCRIAASVASPPALSVEPDILEAPAVVDAVDHDRQPLDLRLHAGGADVVEDDRPRAVLLQLLVDLPNQALPLLRVGDHRLLVEFLVQFLVAIAAVIARRA